LRGLLLKGGRGRGGVEERKRGKGEARTLWYLLNLPDMKS